MAIERQGVWASQQASAAWRVDLREQITSQAPSSATGYRLLVPGRSVGDSPKLSPKRSRARDVAAYSLTPFEYHPGTTDAETQVQPRAQRRVFSIQYKRSIVEQADACSQSSAVAALLRREGLYSSHLTDWRRQYKRGDLQGDGRLRRGPIRPDKPLAPAVEEQQRHIEQLERGNQLLRLRAVKAEALVEFQKKVSCLLGAEVLELRDDVC